MSAEGDGMYQIGESVVYNEDGVCRVEAVGPLNISSAIRDQRYYTLRPLSGDGRIFVPVDTHLPIRAVLSREEALQLIRSIPQVEAEVSRISTKRMLEEHYRELMKPHTPQALVRTLKSVYAKRHDGQKLRPLSSTDENYRKRAEMLLHQELSVALGIEQSEVERFIVNMIEAGS